MTLSTFVRTGLLAAAVAALAGSASAQGHGGPPGGMGGGGFGRPMSGGIRIPEKTTPVSQGGLHLGLPGRWWNDRTVARVVGLDTRQQRRMDDVFNANRDNLQTLYTNLQREEAQLDKITRGRELDENQIFQQIDRVTQARGELEKATAHMQLQIRKELTADQTAKLDEMVPQLQVAQ